MLQPRVLFVNRYLFVSTAKKLASSNNNACRFQQSNNLQYSCCGKRFLSAVDSSTINNEESSSNDDNNIPPRLSVAIVGAGPSGFYSAKYLTSSMLKQIQSATSNSAAEQSIADEEHTSLWSGINIDMIERLPTPYGLVRYGVAPDHPEVKNVENDFASLFNKKDGGRDDTVSSDASISYFGNIDVGKDISITKLQSLYDIVVLAYGCQADNRLGIPGEDKLEGVLSAREFVAWYNGHPEFGHIGSIVKQCLWPSSKENTNESSSKEDNTTAKVSPSKVVVIGQGNVALDVARVLAKGKDGLIDTDTPSSVLQVLQGGVSHVSIFGRRGHVQGAFTIKELRELTKLKKEGHDASFIVRKDELDLGMTESSKAELKGASGRPKTRMDKLLQDSAIVKDKGDTAKQVELRFLMNPIGLEPSDTDPKRVGKVVCKRTKLEGEPFQQKPIQTDETETLDADLVLVSIGYKGMPLDGMEEELFDNQENTVANEHGKVTGDNNLFVSGWIKRGPSGIIGTNIGDAKDTVASIMQFINTKQDVTSQNKKGRTGLTDLLHKQDGVDAICWNQFCKIEEAETDYNRLRSDAQPREKILSIEEMITASS